MQTRRSKQIVQAVPVFISHKNIMVQQKRLVMVLVLEIRRGNTDSAPSIYHLKILVLRYLLSHPLPSYYGEFTKAN